jgi:hypothetical protein
LALRAKWRKVRSSVLSGGEGVSTLRVEEGTSLGRDGVHYSAFAMHHTPTVHHTPYMHCTSRSLKSCAEVVPVTLHVVHTRTSRSHRSQRRGRPACSSKGVDLWR